MSGETKQWRISNLPQNGFVCHGGTLPHGLTGCAHKMTSGSVLSGIASRTLASRIARHKMAVAALKSGVEWRNTSR